MSIIAITPPPAPSSFAPACERCLDDSLPSKLLQAVYLVPQLEGDTFAYALVCKAHATGWFDGDEPTDFPPIYKLEQVDYLTERLGL